MQVIVNIMGVNGPHPVGLAYPTMQSITIKLDDGQEFNIKDGGNGLRISIDGRLVVEPEASNVIQVSELKE